MLALQSSGLFLLSSSPHRTSRTKTVCNAFQIPKNLRKIETLTDDLSKVGGFTNMNFRLFPETDNQSPSSSSLSMAKLYAIFEAVSDRVEMHKNIGKQREEWNSLLLTSINAITLTATTITGIAAASGGAVGPALLALKLSAAVMFSGAAAMLAAMNRIQPAQLVEEQRTAVRLFQQLRNEIQTVLSVGGCPTERHVDNALARVVALDRAYPLPLLGAMLEKFPAGLQPSVWWPEERRKTGETDDNSAESNGWDSRLEEEMRSVAEVLRTKDEEEYKKLGEKALKLSKICAISGPCLTAMAAVGAALVGTSPLAAIVGVVGGALACVVNTVEHGGQIGMVFEMYRNNAGFFKLMEESIESNLMEGKRRENGELFEMKVALNLGRSLSELRSLAGKSSSDEFGSKLF